MIVCFVDIGGIVDHICLDFLFIIEIVFRTEIHFHHTLQHPPIKTLQRQTQGGHTRRPLKIGKNMIFWGKIVVFHGDSVFKCAHSDFLLLLKLSLSGCRSIILEVLT
jgi:hypothetical protein